MALGFGILPYKKPMSLTSLDGVKNTPDGKVEIEAEGDPQNVETFQEWMKIGPARAIVQNCSVSEITPHRNFSNFTIR